MLKHRICCLALALLPLAGHAGLFDDKEARAQIATARQDIEKLQESNRLLSERLAQVEASVKGLRLTEVLNQLEALRAEVAGLRGQFELQTYQIDQLQKRQKDLYTDLDVRLRQQEEQKTPATPPVDTAAEEKQYSAALEAYKKADFTGAARDFENFATSYPNSKLAGNALYWAAAAQAARKDCARAIGLYEKLLSQYPDSSKTAEGLLGLGICQREQKDVSAARNTLQQLIKRFPDSAAAEQARRQLEQLPRAAADKNVPRGKGERK